MKEYSVEVGGKPLIIRTGEYAQNAAAACTVQYGETVILATTVMSDSIREGIDYFPLMVEFEERFYAAGKMKGSRFIKREGRPSDEAVLTGRLIDRGLRPLFDERLRNDVQVVITVLSHDGENDADVLGIIGASCVLAKSNIPWNGPLYGIRIGHINGEWVINPTYEAREKSDMELLLEGKDEHVIMIETEGKEIEEKVVLEAIAFGQKHGRTIQKLIEDVVKAEGVEKIAIPEEVLEPEDEAKLNVVKTKVAQFAENRIADLLRGVNKEEHKAELHKIKDELDVLLKADNNVSKDMRARGVDMVEKFYEDGARKLVLEDGKRVDGRALDEIRPLSAAVHMMPRPHGTGLFRRGETQVMSFTTLGSPGDEQTLDTMELSEKKRYMHHYNFPGYSVGEASPNRGTSRREIGHGALAEKALLPVLPPKEEFPYTIRVVSEVLSSNGSTSQASICGSTLSLMDAGVPITAPVAGIAMGLMTDLTNPKNFRVLTDIQGVEDHVGDMDFKVAGTRKGITAIQLDIKLNGIPFEVCEQALAGARIAREKILDVMKEAIAEPRKELSQYAPRITTIRIDPEQIKVVIGKGGETINKIIDECGGQDVTKIDIEQDGLVMITSTNSAMGEKAVNWIKDLTREITVGEVFEGPVIKIVADQSGNEIGAIIQLTPMKDGMVHISQFSNERIARVSDVVKIGDKLKVKVMEVDTERGRISLSVKAIDPAFVKPGASPMTDHGHSGFGGGDRGRRDGGRPPFRSNIPRRKY